MKKNITVSFLLFCFIIVLLPKCYSTDISSDADKRSFSEKREHVDLEKDSEQPKKIYKKNKPSHSTQLSLFRMWTPKEDLENSANTDKKEINKDLIPFKKAVLSGFDFTDKGPILWIDEFDTEGVPIRNHIPIWNSEFSIEFTDDKYCIGRYDIDTFESFPCLNKNKTQARYQHCYPCNQSLQFNPAFYNVPKDSLSDKQQRYNHNSHNVYLSYFSDSCIKVGISHYLRTERRLLEQGARAAIILSSCPDAYKARALEEFVVKNFSEIKESVTSVQKKKCFKETYNPDKAFLKLSAWKQQISHQIPITETEERFNFQDRYIQSGHVLSLANISDEQTPKIIGKGVGLIGDVLFIETKEGLHAISLNKLLGRVLKIL